MNKRTHWILGSLSVAAVLAGCAAGPSVSELNDLAQKIAKASFRDEGIVKAAAVLNTDETNRLCSDADVAGKPLDEATAKRIEETNLKTVKWPSDGKFLGDWKEGEKIAQNGRGLQFSDAANTVNGGNCYACHQLSPKELSFGNFGPSLYKYGVTRGVKDPSAKESEAIVKYTWAKIWNTHAFNACSHMPRFGDAGILTEQQVKDVMALLLDPNSHVNH